MQFLDEYQEIVAKAVDKYTFKDKPTELYDPMNYIISHGGKRLRPIMVLMANDMFGGDLQKEPSGGDFIKVEPFDPGHGVYTWVRIRAMRETISSAVCRMAG